MSKIDLMFVASVVFIFVVYVSFQIGYWKGKNQARIDSFVSKVKSYFSEDMFGGSDTLKKSVTLMIILLVVGVFQTNVQEKKESAQSISLSEVTIPYNPNYDLQGIVVGVVDNDTLKIQSEKGDVKTIEFQKEQVFTDTWNEMEGIHIQVFGMQENNGNLKAEYAVYE